MVGDSIIYMTFNVYLLNETRICNFNQKIMRTQYIIINVIRYGRFTSHLSYLILYLFYHLLFLTSNSITHSSRIAQCHLTHIFLHSYIYTTHTCSTDSYSYQFLSHFTISTNFFWLNLPC